MIFLMLWLLALCAVQYAEGFRSFGPSLGKSSIMNCHQLPSTRLQLVPTHSGLLEGISDVSSALFYSQKIYLPQAAALVKNKSWLYEIVKADCENDEKAIDKYLFDIKDRMKCFMDKNEVFDREDLKRGLNYITEVKGNFACLLGGKSTGKTLVLKEFSRKEVKNRKVIYIDLRDNPSIFYGFVESIKKSKNKSWIQGLEAFFKRRIQPVINNDFEINFSSFLDGIRMVEEEPISSMGSLLEEMVAGNPEDIITLIVDEANLALTINEKTSETKIEQVKATLSLFTSLTKQDKKVW